MGVFFLPPSAQKNIQNKTEKEGYLYRAWPIALCTTTRIWTKTRSTTSEMRCLASLKVLFLALKVAALFFFLPYLTWWFTMAISIIVPMEKAVKVVALSAPPLCAHSSHYGPFLFSLDHILDEGKQKRKKSRFSFESQPTLPNFQRKKK